MQPKKLLCHLRSVGAWKLCETCVPDGAREGNPVLWFGHWLGLALRSRVPSGLTGSAVSAVLPVLIVVRESSGRGLAARLCGCHVYKH